MEPTLTELVDFMCIRVTGVQSWVVPQAGQVVRDMAEEALEDPEVLKAWLKEWHNERD